MRILLSAFLLSYLIAASAADSLSINVDAQKSQFEVSLPANPTTGYQWTVQDYDRSFLKLLASQYKGPETKLIGAGGQMIFRFLLVKGKIYPKKTKMLFKYARPWDAQSGSFKKVFINFKNH